MRKTPLASDLGAIFKELLTTSVGNYQLDRLISTATTQYKQGNYQAALKNCGAALQIDNNCLAAWRCRGLANQKLNNHEVAILDFSKLIQLDQNSAFDWLRRGLSHLSLQHYDQAISDLTQAIKLDKTCKDGWLLRGCAQSDKGALPEAIQSLQVALELDPSNMMIKKKIDTIKQQQEQSSKQLAVLLESANQKCNRQDYLGVEHDCDQAIKIDCNNACAWHLRGESKRLRHQYVESIKDFEKAIQLNPTFHKSWWTRAECYRQLQQYDRAMADIQKSIELDPQFAHSWYTRGLINRYCDRYMEAIKDCDKALELNPTLTGPWHTKAVSNRKLGRNEEAIRNCDQAIIINPNIASIWVTRAHSLFELERYHEALKDYQQGLKLDPSNQVALQKISVVNAKLADIDTKQTAASQKPAYPVVASTSRRMTTSQPAYHLLTEKTAPNLTKKVTTNIHPPKAVINQAPSPTLSQSWVKNDTTAASSPPWAKKKVAKSSSPLIIHKPFAQASSPSWVKNDSVKSSSPSIVKKTTVQPSSPSSTKKVSEKVVQFGASVQDTIKKFDQASQTHNLSSPIVEKKPTLAPAQKSWHIDDHIKQQTKLTDDKPYVLVDAGFGDIQKARQFYSHHPVPGMDIGRIQIIFNPGMNRKFELRLGELEERKKSSAFNPDWSNESERNWRSVIAARCDSLARPFCDNDYPNVKLLPLWHGTKKSDLDSIFRTGFANLAKTDPGFFGKGIYSANEAEYSYRVFAANGASAALLLNWVSFYSAFPVIDGDMPKLASKGNYSNYDAHYVPVVSKSGSLFAVNYFPTKPQQTHRYTEVVVFDSAQCMPRYVVELVKSQPMKALAQNGFFAHSNQDFDLLQAATYAYNNYLFKPYDLVMVDGKNWQWMDWEYSHGGTTIARPNHGLPHSIGMAAYVPFVVEHYIEHQKLSQNDAKQLHKSIPWLQLCGLFFVAGRRNELGFKDNPQVYKDFRVRSGEAMTAFLRSIGYPNKTQMQRYRDLVVNCYVHDGHENRILGMCHDLELIRCIKPDDYKGKLNNIGKHIGNLAAQQLSRLALSIMIERGDRVTGDEHASRGYQGELFVICSTNINRCYEQTERGIQVWKQQMFDLSN